MISGQSRHLAGDSSSAGAAVPPTCAFRQVYRAQQTFRRAYESRGNSDIGHEPRLILAGQVQQTLLNVS